MRQATVALFAVLHVFALGCVAEPYGDDEEDDVAPREAPLEGSNALNLNALNLNALNLNALNAGSLDASSIAALKDPGSTGELARELVEYAVGCALQPAQSFEFSWTDGSGQAHDEVYKGVLGLAPGWAQGPLSAEGEWWISACLASRVNWYGTPVMLSSRGPHGSLNQTPAWEKNEYPMREGAFWGNLFEGSPTIYACHYAANIQHSRDKLRECAAGHVKANGNIEQCGIINIVGPCEAHCEGLDPSGEHYQSCGESPQEAESTNVITVWLAQ